MRNQSLAINDNPLIQRSRVPGWLGISMTICPSGAGLHGIYSAELVSWFEAAPTVRAGLNTEIEIAGVCSL